MKTEEAKEGLKAGDVDPKVIRPALARREASRPDIQEFAKTSLAGLVADRIRSDIYSGRYLPGQKLIVRELSEAMGISHTPVKDALTRLIAEGYVESSPRKSMVVRRFTNDDLIENLGVRLMCEVFYAREVIGGAGEDGELIGDLLQAWEGMNRVLSDPDRLDYEAWVREEAYFHQRYMSVCRNSKLVSVYQDLDSNKFTFFAYLNNNQMPLTRKNFELNQVEHREIIDALAALDERRFVRAVKTHVIRACEDYAIDASSRGKIEHMKALAESFGN
ncbi:GntR family transcriptional regulator [Aminithiophilus ramosus]|uniref:GntR family transcriptional regulator n=2 Tax=Synergistales TaxID=649776 RepID=A0A9Q7ANI2_9BACT|nr:GntR family transcriptional regulator [Aminithiophilus ramosus]QTX31401.1 GntR family transcriptional regulator [Aminithiophilus ramosus]QVL35201.1 GntR family transcriptional regulator [Synergistota bacterium]